MPESRSRKRAPYTPPASGKRSVSGKQPVKIGGHRWIAPAMITCWVLGLAWIVVFYLAPGVPVIRDLGNWNLVIGMTLIAVGFILSTKWE